jgi:AraC-like DNA-binding protein
MIGLIEDVNICSSFKSQSISYGKKENRISHGFIFKIKGYTEYIFKDKKLTVNAGQVIFLPQGASYEYYSYGDDRLYTSINFYGTVENPSPCVYSLEDYFSSTFIFESFTELWRFGSLSDKYKCLSAFYDFLSYIERVDRLKATNSNKYPLIEPAIDYLKEHLFDCHLKIDNLHRLCCISDTYFRKLFIARFSATPQEYVISKRLAHALAIIESGDFMSIGEVAEQVGYKDPLYFSKAFKKLYGFSPTEINT